SLAFIDALTAVEARRVAVIATYTEPASLALAEFLGAYVIAVSGLSWRDAASGFDAANIEPERLCHALDSADLRDADAVLVPDTALATLEIVERLEKMCGHPVLTANQVTLWATLGLARRSFTTHGFGRIFTTA